MDNSQKVIGFLLASKSQSYDSEYRSLNAECFPHDFDWGGLKEIITKGNDTKVRFVHPYFGAIFLNLYLYQASQKMDAQSIEKSFHLLYMRLEDKKEIVFDLFYRRRKFRRYSDFCCYLLQKNVTENDLLRLFDYNIVMTYSMAGFHRLIAESRI